MFTITSQACFSYTRNGSLRLHLPDGSTDLYAFRSLSDGSLNVCTDDYSRGFWHAVAVGKGRDPFPHPDSPHLAWA